MVEEIDVYAKEPPQIPDSFIYPFTDEEMEAYILLVYAEAIKTDTLSIPYYERVFKALTDALIIGYGNSLESLNFTSTEYQVLQKLQRNIYRFSAAKQYQQVRTMSAFINEKGVKSTFSEFKKLAQSVFETYNKNWLKTEYNTAIGQAQMAREWINADNQKELFPLLQYRTQRDARVRDEHTALHGVTLPVGHKFWDTYHPKNGFNCRCYTVQLKRGKQTDLGERDLSDLQDEQKFPKTFRINPGKDGLVFDPKTHPYFRVAKGDKNLRENNFNLPLP